MVLVGFVVLRWSPERAGVAGVGRVAADVHVGGGVTEPRGAVTRHVTCGLAPDYT